jgi:hypothetical protein
MNRTYTGLITIAAAAQDAYVDIDPPQRDGYGFQVRKLDIMCRSDDTAGGYVHVVGSVKAAPRTTYRVLTDGFAADLLWIGKLAAQGTSLLYGYDEKALMADGMQFDEGYVAAVPVLADKVRVLASMQTAAVAAGKSVVVAYSIELEEVRLTQVLQEEIYRKSYT